MGKWIKTYYETDGFGRFGREVNGSLDRKYLEDRLVFRRESAARKVVEEKEGEGEGKIWEMRELNLCLY